MSRIAHAVVLGLALVPSAISQVRPHAKTSSKSGTRTPTTSALSPYTACRFEDGLALSETLPLPSSAVGRTVETMHGTAHIPLLRGERLFFSYPATDPFAKVVVEQLPAGSFDESKADLVSNFDQILSSDNGTRNYALKPTLNGFEIYGLDRSRLQGGAVGVYLLIDDRSGIVTTIYFLDASPGSRKFADIAEYTRLRDHFLNTYTTCLHTPSRAVVSPGAKSKSKPKH